MKALEIVLFGLEGEKLWLETGLEDYGTLNCGDLCCGSDFASGNFAILEGWGRK